MVFKFLRRSMQSQPDGPASVDEERLRRTARRRLMGAGVLLAITAVVFPWVFERQPKPINDDIVIEIPRKDAAKALALPSAAPSSATIPVTREVASAPQVSASEAEESLPRSALARVIAGTATMPATAAVAVTAEASKPAVVASTPVTVASAPVAPASKPARLASKPEASASKSAPVAAKPAATGRFAVQVGAFAEATKARETRLKLEAAGYKTYSQKIESSKGVVWRVRVGPIESRQKADEVKARLALLGFSPSILDLDQQITSGSR